MKKFVILLFLNFSALIPVPAQSEFHTKVTDTIIPGSHEVNQKLGLKAVEKEDQELGKQLAKTTILLLAPYAAGKLVHLVRATDVFTNAALVKKINDLIRKMLTLDRASRVPLDQAFLQQFQDAIPS